MPVPRGDHLGRPLTDWVDLATVLVKGGYFDNMEDAMSMASDFMVTWMDARVGGGGLYGGPVLLVAEPVCIDYETSWLMSPGVVLLTRDAAGVLKMIPDCAEGGTAA